MGMPWCRLLKKSEVGALPEVYLEAMKATFRRVADQLTQDAEDGAPSQLLVSLRMWGGALGLGVAGAPCQAPQC